MAQAGDKYHSHYNLNNAEYAAFFKLF